MIDFQVEGVEMPDINQENVTQWLKAVVENHGKSLGNVAYRFCSDEVILDANNKYLGHDYFTDIITFDYTRKNRVSGDIYLSLDTVASNAEEIGVEYSRELLRVIVHGVLHLCGIDDKGPGEREIMEAHEDAALSLYDSMF